MTPRATLSLLLHADKAIDVVRTALDLGLLDRLDQGPASLGALCERAGAAPLRMYKFLDCLESLGLVERRQPQDALESAVYVAVAPLAAAARQALGPESIERDRDRYPWRELHGRLPEVLRGRRDARFDWPPATPEAFASFQASMAAGVPPIVESFCAHAADLFGAGRDARWLDVGGGDGALAAAVLARGGARTADVYDLPAVEPLAEARAAREGVRGRLGFVPGDFLRDDLPRGYDVVSFVRVLHDWPAETARRLLAKAAAALAPGKAIVVSEEFRTSDRLALQFFWTYFLVGADSCVSRLREAAWYEAALGDAGFGEVRVLGGGPFEIVVARKRGASTQGEVCP